MHATGIRRVVGPEGLENNGESTRKNVENATEATVWCLGLKDN